jgi:hypothetical protein
LRADNRNKSSIGGEKIVFKFMSEDFARYPLGGATVIELHDSRLNQNLGDRYEPKIEECPSTEEGRFAAGPREFPIASTLPELPVMISDQMLDLYAFLFCQGGFRQMGLTFEQFLLVVAVVKPGDLQSNDHETSRVFNR